MEGRHIIFKLNTVAMNHSSAKRHLLRMTFSFIILTIFLSNSVIVDSGRIIADIENDELADRAIVRMQDTGRSGYVSGEVLKEELLKYRINVVDLYDNCALLNLSEYAENILKELNVEIIEIPMQNQVFLNRYSFDTTKEMPNIAPAQIVDAVSNPNYNKYLIQFIGPINARWVRELQSINVTFLDYFPNFAYVISIVNANYKTIRDFPYIQWMDYYQPAYKVSPDLLNLTERINVTVNLFQSANEDNTDYIIGAILSERGCIQSISSKGNRKFIDTDLDGSAISKLIHYPEVKSIEKREIRNASLLNDRATWVIQSNEVDYRSIFNHGITGRVNGIPQLIALTDSGITPTHPVFYDSSHSIGDDHRKIQSYTPLWYYVPIGDNLEPSEHVHGTPVASVIAGDGGTYGQYSDGSYDGNAFQARLIVQDNERNGVISFPPDMYNWMFTGPYSDGARIHTVSQEWTDGINQYDTYSQDIDEFLFDHLDHTIIFSAGNIGPDANTIREYGNSKNSITVGGCYNGIDADNLWDMSSRGYSIDGRIKPTVVVPGIDLNVAWPPNIYAGTSGTSFSAPCVAGAVSLIRQYFLDGWYPSGEPKSTDSLNPSSSLVRAILINGAVEITGDDAYTHGNLYPNSDQGWGRVNLENSLYFNGDDRSLIIDDSHQFTSSGQTHEFKVRVSDGSIPFEATLAWTDPESQITSGGSPRIVNDLDLLVIDPQGNQYKGNVFSGINPGQSTVGYQYDRLNVEEDVLRIAPSVGIWTVRVSSYSVALSPQSYSLAITYGNGNILKDDFSDGNTVDWKITQTGGYVGIDSNAGKHSAPCLKINKQTTAGQSSATRFFGPQQGRVIVDLNARVDTTSKIGYITLRDGDSLSHVAVYFAFKYGSFAWYDGVGGSYGWHTIRSYNANEWYHITFDVNIPAQTYQIFVDAPDTATAANFYYKASGMELDNIYLQSCLIGSESGLSMYCDDIDIRKAQLLCIDQFQDGTTTGWTLDGSGGWTGIDSSQQGTWYYDKGPCLKLSRTSSSGKSSAQRYFTSQSSHVFASMVARTDTDNSGEIAYLTLGSDANIRAYFAFRQIASSDWRFSYYASDGWHNIGSYSPNNWYRISFDISVNSGTYDIYIDGVIRQQNAALYSTGSINNVYLQAYYGSYHGVNLWVDDVSIMT